MAHPAPTGDTCLDRTKKPEEVAQTIHALVTNPFITAQTISVDGGMYPR